MTSMNSSWETVVKILVSLQIISTIFEQL